MSRNLLNSGLIFILALGVSACAPLSPPATPIAQLPSPTPMSEAPQTSAPEATLAGSVPVTGHAMKPAEFPATPASVVQDVTSSADSAPYGDSYKINRFERPFQKDMTYVPDLDILRLSLAQDADWHYASIELNGSNPNNSIGIDYGLELDVNADGYGDYIIWAHPPYSTHWDTSTVEIYKDSNHDSGGRFSQQSGAVSTGNGYDTLIFNGGDNQNADPDIAWVRMVEGPHALIQFAFKKSWAGPSFMIGAVADAGMKDVSKYDYNGQSTEANAGSPVRNNQYYPLGTLYAVDNTCWLPDGMQITTPNLKFCPAPGLASATKKPKKKQADNNPAGGPTACTPPNYCGPAGYNPDTCECN